MLKDLHDAQHPSRRCYVFRRAWMWRRASWSAYGAIARTGNHIKCVVRSRVIPFAVEKVLIHANIGRNAMRQHDKIQACYRVWTLCALHAARCTNSRRTIKHYPSYSCSLLPSRKAHRELGGRRATPHARPQICTPPARRASPQPWARLAHRFPAGPADQKIADVPASPGHAVRTRAVLPCAHAARRLRCQIMPQGQGFT